MKKNFLFMLVVFAVLLSFLSVPVSAGGLNIAIVTSPNDVHDGGFNKDNYNGLLAFQKEHPDTQITLVQEKTGDPALCVKAAADVAADFDVVVCTGFQFSGVTEVAEDNPDVKFILVDVSGVTDELSNVYAMTFKEEESGFFAGIAAALSTKTKKVAVVNGIAIPTNVNYQYGFMSGVNYANRHYGTDAEIVELPSYSGIDVTARDVGGNYIGSFVDQANGKIVGQSLIREGCDVIFVAAGVAGMGVFTAAKEAEGVYVIGCDADQYDDGANGSSNIVLTSVLKVMGKNDYRVLNEILAGKFKGGNYLLGADTDSTGYVKTKGRCQLTDDAVKKIDAAVALVKAKKILPASSSSGTMPDNFTGLDAE
ncbi:MAG: BMP family ABC transporter substrate-binding protein [Synergistaceae bacterium]|nr:BMP family ABC transporter substrate-binding protein [Synergistaceae bacterium]